MSPELDRLIEEAKRRVAAMSREEVDAMLRAQALSWARAEAQWAKDFREGKCRRD